MTDEKWKRNALISWSDVIAYLEEKYYVNNLKIIEITNIMNLIFKFILCPNDFFDTTYKRVKRFRIHFYQKKFALHCFKISVFIAQII